MMVLPSGRVVDISTDRSKYHALQHSGISSTSSHRKLYSLVDVIYRKQDDSGVIKQGWTEYDYEFSGYTLDSVRFAGDWSKADKAELFNWIKQKEQQHRIESTRRRLTNNQEHLSVKHYSSPQHLYSLLRSRLQALPQKRASVTQWLSTIRNMKQNGIREKEIKWYGLTRYLARFDKKQLVKKSNRIKYLTNKHLRLELSIEQQWGNNGSLNFKEVELRMPHQVVYRAPLKLNEN